MKYCTFAKIERREGFNSHVDLTITTEKPESECGDGYVITLMRKGFFAGLTPSGFISTTLPSEAIIFRNIADAQMTINCSGLYPCPGINKLEYGIKLVEGWENQKSR